MSLRKGNITISGMGIAGYSPSASVSQIADTTTISITDKNGTTTATIDLSDKQNTTDNSLQTTNKTVSTAINEVNSIAKGANQALSYNNYSAMITEFNALSSSKYNVGQNIYIITLDVPDLWVSSVENTSQTYTYTTDSAFISALETNGYVQVGYYKLSALETQEVNLTNYVKNTDYATSSVGGVIKSGGAGHTSMSNGVLIGESLTYANYNNVSNNSFISKGTLENVITGKQLVSQTDLSSKQDIIQYSTMPTASSSNEGEIIQYIGTNTNDYTNGYFYKCVEDNNVYTWENVNVQTSSSEAIAPVYSSSSTYNEGDYVSYQGKLYVCNTTISSAEAWNLAHWTQTTAMSVIGNINTILSSLVSVGGGN